jgi:hypothetical protein
MRIAGVWAICKEICKLNIALLVVAVILTLCDIPTHVTFRDLVEVDILFCLILIGARLDDIYNSIRKPIGNHDADT